MEILPAVGGMARYRIFHGPSDVRDYYADQLEAATAPQPPSDFVAGIAVGRILDADVFRARLTAARLAHPQIDNLYALQAARIKYIPFQFKPLLRFLRADQPRLLIADEVGVGKTIEAGLILKELQTRLGGTFYYLCSVLDGYSRAIVHWEIREAMREVDVETILQRARENHPQARPRIISDNGPQFIAREFKEFIRIAGMTHVRTSPYYPQSNGKIEAWQKPSR
jgi:hypothetical protein